MRRWFGVFFRQYAAALLLLLGLAACSAPRTDDALRLSSGNPETANTLVYLVPGVLSSTSVFGPALDWGNDEIAVVEFRFPGLDGRPLDAPLRILRAGEEIGRHAKSHKAERIVLIGFSTGAAISIEAGARIPDREVTVVGVSAAVPFPGMLLASLGSTTDVLEAGARSDSLEYDPFWRLYYRTLLLGRSWPFSEQTRARADALMQRYEDLTAEPPEAEMATAHASDLLVWQLSPEARGSGAKHVFWHGQNDTISPLRGVRRLSRELNAPLYVLGGLGHMALEAEPELIRVIGARLGLR